LKRCSVPHRGYWNVSERRSNALRRQQRVVVFVIAWARLAALALRADSSRPARGGRGAGGGRARTLLVFVAPFLLRDFAQPHISPCSPRPRNGQRSGCGPELTALTLADASETPASGLLAGAAHTTYTSCTHICKTRPTLTRPCTLRCTRRTCVQYTGAHRIIV
jgi:hypothetical protein